MPIFKSKPLKKIVNGKEVMVSDSAVITNESYNTNGEYVIVVKDVDLCQLFLNSETTEHVVIKAMTNVNVTSNTLIDEEYDEVELNKGACVEFRKIGDFWYILSSDGLKSS